MQSRPEEISQKMSESELKIKIDCGAVEKQLDPTIPSSVQDGLSEENKVYRYKFVVVSSCNSTNVKRKLTKENAAIGDEAHFSLATRPPPRKTKRSGKNP